MHRRRLLLLALVAAAGCDRVFSIERDELPEGAWVDVAAGVKHTCAIKLDGTLWCWGQNRESQLGAMGATEQTTPLQIGAARWRQVSARWVHTCGIQEDGSLWCWGLNNYGQIGLSTPANIVLVPALVDSGPWEHVETGWGHTCAIRADTTLWCWGLGDQGQLGVGDITWRTVPTQLPDAGWVRVSGHRYHTCGIKSDHSLWCWGSNDRGELADPNSTSELAPHRARGEWIDVAVGSSFTCAISTEGRLRCWGMNGSGQLGDGTTSDSRLGVVVGGDEVGWERVIAGDAHMCATRDDGSLHCWGDNTRGQIPSPRVGVIASVPTQVVPVTPGTVLPWRGSWARVALGSQHTCAIDDGHRLWCAGLDSARQLGRDLPSHLVPRQVPGTWRAVGAGELSTCALDDASQVRCWGNNARSQLGDGTRIDAQVPTAILFDGPFDAITVGYRQACAQLDTKRVCWGGNEYGQLATGTTTDVFLPSSFEGPFPLSASYHMCAIENGALACWGYNGTGEIGDGSTGQAVTSPQPSNPTLAPWTLVATGGYHTCGVAGGQLYCWGLNTRGQLGLGTTVDHTTAVAVGTGGADALALGRYSTCRVRAGVAECWGDNSRGQLGIGRGVYSTPTALQGAFRQVAIMDFHGCGIAMDGSLWCWGANDGGQLGIGSFEEALTPLQIDAATHWKQVVTGSDHACALTNDGALWCWGVDDNGALGFGDAWSNELLEIR